MPRLQQTVKLALEDECPYPDLYWGERPYSIIIEMSQFNATTLDTPGLLALLREQFPQGISVNQRMIKIFNNRTKSKSSRKKKAKPFIEIGFANEGTRAQALKRPFILNGQTIQVSKTLDKSVNHHEVYRIQIYDIDKLNNPSNHYNQILGYLNKFGKVIDLHLHYAQAGGSKWFTGEGCCIWIDKQDSSVEEFGFYKHPKLEFAVDTYRVNG